MDLRRCVLVVGGIAASLLVLWMLGVFEPAALAPSRVINGGGTRSLIAIALLLVSAMIIASSCRREPDRNPVAKNGSEPRNKTTA